MSESRKSFFKATLLIAFFSLLSRILGVLRSTLLAAFYGATTGEGLNDCYTAAFKLPDIIFNLVAAGAISIVLIPYLSTMTNESSKENINKATSQFMNLFFILISIFLVIGFFFAPFFVTNWLVSGWNDIEKVKLTIRLTRILLLQVLFMTLSSVISSYLNAIEKFFSYSLAMLSYNIGIIFGIIFLTPIFNIYGVIIGVVIGGFLHFFIQLIGAKINGFKYYFSLPKFDRELFNLFIVAVPRIIAISLDQIVRFFLVSFASFIFIGSIFIFDNIENIGMLFYGMIAVSISTAAFPNFVKLYNTGNYNELFNSYLEKIKTMLFFMLPMTLLMILFKYEIVEILLGYNKFVQNDIKLTAEGLKYYLIGIPFLSITIITVKFYYAQKKSLIPMFIAVISVTISIIATFFLSKSLKINGLAIGRGIGFISQAIMLIVVIFFINQKQIEVTKIGLANFKDFFKIIIANALLFIPLLFFTLRLNLFSINKINYILDIFVNSGIFIFIYLIICYIMKVEEVNFLIKTVLNKLKIRKNKV